MNDPPAADAGESTAGVAAAAAAAVVVVVGLLWRGDLGLCTVIKAGASSYLQRQTNRKRKVK